MSTRILPLLFALPLLAACEAVEPTAEPTAPPVTEAASPAARPEGIAAGEPAPTPAAASGAAAPAPTPVAAAPGGGLAPPPAADVGGEVEVASAAPAAAPPTPVATPSGQLGTTVASLGSPTEGGLWLETPLVEAPTQGRVEYNGQTVAVQLRPSGGEPGSGSQISLEAMRALGAPLTGLPELTVYGG